MILISAIICTYNRSKMLMGALESLAQQSLDPHCYEIIVVDNASTDETPDIIQAFQEKHPGHTIVQIYEPQQGLGYARNTGLRHACGRYVAYLDDDARAPSDWLKNAIELFETVKPTPICIGGPVLPFYETPKPEWFKDDYETRTHGDKPRCLCRDEAFTGTNMVWRKGTVESLGGFEVSLGVRGSCLFLGEETALFDRAWRSFDHPVLYYSPRLSVHHLVTPYQMTIAYQLKWEFVYGQVWNRIYGPTAFGSRLLLLVRLLWGITKVGSLALWRGRAHAYWQSWLIEEWKPVARRIGILFGILRLSVPARRRRE